MATKEIKNLALKIQVTREYLENGGVQKIPDPALLQDLTNARFDDAGNPDPDSITPRLNAFMIGLLASHSSPPFFDPEHISEYRSFLQKDLFYEQQNVETKEQADQMFQDFDGKINYVFRGQREAKWRLYNKAQRQWLNDGIFNYDVSYQAFLEEMIALGKQRYLNQIQATLQKTHADTANDIGILGFLQHHGCPTPLMDWTFNFQTGLFFAFDGFEYNGCGPKIDHYVSLYYVEKDEFEGGSMRGLLSGGLVSVSGELLDIFINAINDPDERDKMREKLADRSFFDRARIPGSGFIRDMVPVKRMMSVPQAYFSDDSTNSGLIFSLINSKNIISQQGVFTWNASPVLPFEIVAAKEYEKDKKDNDPSEFRFCKCLNIHKSLVPHILEKLTSVGVTSATVYPTTAKDLDTRGIYEEVKNGIIAAGNRNK